MRIPKKSYDIDLKLWASFFWIHLYNLNTINNVTVLDTQLGLGQNSVKESLSLYRQVSFIVHLVAGTAAGSTALLIGVNNTTAANSFHRLRVIIADEESKKTMDYGEFEVNGSDFDNSRKGKRGRGATRKVLFLKFLKWVKRLIHR